MADLQTLLNTVPTAGDGDVITTQYHNTIRDTLAAIVNQLSTGPVSQTVTLTFAPNFFQSGTDPTWSPSLGFVDKPGGGIASGWFPLQLPNGSHIQSMTVFGRRSGTVPSFQVHLLRQLIIGTDTITLIAIPLSAASDPFEVTGVLQVAGAGPAANEEYKTVDNLNYKYLAEARLVNADANAVVQIHSIQVTYSR